MATDRTEPDAWVLFDVDELLRTATDQRSVGEILWCADHRARELLGEVGDDDAGAVLRGWPAVIEAANDAWAAIPAPAPSGPSGDTEDRMAQLQASAAAINRTLSRDWPGHGESDARMAQIASDLSRAARLVQRFGRNAPIQVPAVRHDIAAARTRIMHTVHVATHAVIVAMHHHGRTRYLDARRAGEPVSQANRHSPYTAGATGRWITRLGACEAMAGGFIAPGFPHVLAYEVRPAACDADRFERALTGWDLQVHRTLAHAPNATNIEAVCRTEAGIASGGQVLIAAARAGGRLPSTMASDQLDAALGYSATAWRDVAARWSDLRSPTTPPDLDLSRAAAEVRAAFREIAHDATTMAPLDEIAERPATAPAATAVVSALESAAQRAHVVTEHADTPGLSGPARTLSRRAQADLAVGLSEPPPGQEEHTPVSPVDIAAKRWIALPRPVADGLRAATEAVLTTTSSAAAAAAVHTPEPAHLASTAGTPAREARREPASSLSRPTAEGNRPSR